MRFWVFFWTLSACAQVTTSAISGYVLDPSQKPIAHAEVTLSQPERGLVRTAWTDDVGFYLLAELPPAAYTISAKAPAFLPASTDLSDRISKDLKKRGFRFVGSTIIYAFLQAVGVVNDHSQACFLAPKAGKASGSAAPARKKRAA